jgi:hypothetical protein
MQVFCYIVPETVCALLVEVAEPAGAESEVRIGGFGDAWALRRESL